MVARRSDTSGELHELGLAASRAIRNGEVCSDAYVGVLLERARRHADLKAFITIDDMAVLTAAQAAGKRCWSFRHNHAYGALGREAPDRLRDRGCARRGLIAFVVGCSNRDDDCLDSRTTRLRLTAVSFTI
jgi:adenylate kinase family enzyme